MQPCGDRPEVLANRVQLGVADNADDLECVGAIGKHSAERPRVAKNTPGKRFVDDRDFRRGRVSRSFGSRPVMSGVCITAKKPELTRLRLVSALVSPPAVFTFTTVSHAAPNERRRTRVRGPLDREGQ